MAEDAFGTQSDYSRQEPHVVCSSASGVHEISTRLMAHMLGLEAPGSDPPSPYYSFQSRSPSMAGPLQPCNQLSYPPNAGFTNGIQPMNPVAIPEEGSGSGANWAQNIGAPGNFGINNPSYPNFMYDFGGYGV
jgi:hypothetical protein